MRARVALLVVAALLAVPAAAQAKPRFGLVTAAYLARDPGPVLAQAVAAGARWTREDVAWYRVQPFPGVWDWRATDRLMAAAAHRRVRVLPLLLGTPCWAAPRRTPTDACSHTLPAGNAAFARFVAHAAARYAPGGAFWRTHPRLDDRVAPRWFEVWNEPEFAAPHARHGASPARYARLLKAAVDAGRAAAPDTRWLAAATADVRNPRTGRWTSWARGMVRAVPDIGTRIDALAVHPYPAGRPPAARPRSGSDASFHRTELIAAQFGAAGLPRPVWITEVGYSACDPRSRNVPRGWCVPGVTATGRERRKARWLAELLAEAAGPRYADVVDAVFVYALYEGGGTPLERRFGLLGPGSRRLPAWHAFRAAAER